MKGKTIKMSPELQRIVKDQLASFRTYDQMRGAHVF